MIRDNSDEKEDGFLKMEKIKMPDFASVVFFSRKRISKAALGDLFIIAYAYDCALATCHGLKY